MPTPRLDLTDKKFGRLTGIRPLPKETRRVKWEFRCECKALVIAQGWQVKIGQITSCGCSRPRQGGLVIENYYTYLSWTGMIRRCEDKRSKWWSRYGARGISVYFDWLGDGGFVNFLRDMGPRPDNKTLDRYPNCNGNYGPDNCRWATAKQQRLNQERAQPWTAKNSRKNAP